MQIYYKLFSYSSAVELLQSIFPAEEVFAEYYHSELVYYHLAKNYYSLGLNNLQITSIELAKDYFDKALHLIRIVEKVFLYLKIEDSL